MSISLRSTPLAIRSLGFVLACAAGFAVGGAWSRVAPPTAARADGHAKSDKTDIGVKAPIAEVMHCPLAFAGVHLLKELPEYSQVAYHFCKPVNADLNQCLLYDGTGPDARLLGVEYLVSDELYQKMPPEERVYWHDHKHEVDAGLLRSVTQTGDDEKKTLAQVRTLWGKVYHTWSSGKSYPSGPARLFWSVTGKEPFVLAPDAKLPDELKATLKSQ
ncbi:MAG: DUF1264 domain-containing protein [Planctomycetota bacterium]|nr:DUF1264 domain-containing protein [Planctomycetota bacterium]